MAGSQSGSSVCIAGRKSFNFNLAEPKYHRLLIDLLARAQKYAAAHVKIEEQETSIDAELGLGKAHVLSRGKVVQQ